MAAPGVEVGIYLPQVGFSWDEILDRALLCEELGFHSVWFMDHLYPPEMPRVPSFEAWTTATAVLARTARLRAGHLVLSNTFRHPALLAKMAASLDVISGGRLELGLGSGSYAAEHERAGIAWGSARRRAADLGEALAVLRSMLRQPETTFEGATYRVREMPNLPAPLQPGGPPLHVGGAGERLTLPLVARWADVWSCPTYALGELDQKRDVLAACCAEIGRDPATLLHSVESVLVLVREESELAAARAVAEKRFGGSGWGLAEGGFLGTPDAVAARIRALAARGITFFVFFLHDRAAPATLRLLAEEVLPALRA
jgi:alkanesulfonate monooxygenase SsuD/methylene tetrahydromethanopterin reductase-like flavin-dependent oxidoreductase (luciferase family)